MDANLIAPRLEYVKRWAPEDWYMAFQGKTCTCCPRATSSSSKRK